METRWSDWPFGQSELTAGLRRHLKQADLVVARIWEEQLQSRPAMGHIRGLGVEVVAGGEQHRYTFMLKQPQGTTRVGLAGVGVREIGLYKRLSSDVPVAIPTMVAAAKDGGWLVLEALPPGPPPETWTARTYSHAITELGVVHDRFWELAEDLAAFPWLGRPLTTDYEVYIMAAAKAFESLVFENKLTLIISDPSQISALSQLISQADVIVAVLRHEPQTLLHGDYWPGNISASNPDAHVIFDWQLVGIGPGINDLVSFLTKSQWWFGTLPLEPHELVERYRNFIAERTHHSWTDDEWERLWDYALMWIFTTEWLNLLAASPSALLQTRRADIEAIWLQPVLAAIERQLAISG